MNFCQESSPCIPAQSQSVDCCCCATSGQSAGLAHWLRFFVIISIVLAAAWLMGAAGQPASTDDGEALYLSRCMSCHQVDGNGIAGVFPPVNGTEWVTGDKGVLIRIVLGGVMGPMQVGNVTYSGAMPPWNSFLDDEEVAALLTYMRSAWDNDASAVTAEEVRLVRAATAERTAAWTAAELEDEANQGIPGAFGFLTAPQDTTDH